MGSCPHVFHTLRVRAAPVVRVNVYKVTVRFPERCNLRIFIYGEFDGAVDLPRTSGAALVVILLDLFGLMFSVADASSCPVHPHSHQCFIIHHSHPHSRHGTRTRPHTHTPSRTRPHTHTPSHAARRTTVQQVPVHCGPGRRVDARVWRVLLHGPLWRHHAQFVPRLNCRTLS